MNMASGLCLLGRGDRRRSLYVLSHTSFALMGGALAGFAIGAIGLLLPTEARMFLAAAGATFAAYLAVAPPATATGLRRQVARRLERRLHPLLAYSVWGVELGSGLSTLIPYSAFLLLLAIELLAGPLLGATAGAAFGVVREGTAVIVARGATSPAPIAALLPRLAPQARLANLAFCVAGSTALFAEILR